MTILAIESSAVTASVAILNDEALVAEYTVNYKKTHSQTLLPMIDEICNMTETKPEDIDIVAVSEGPGSFTGLRIGCATGKGIALSLDKKMISVPTFEAMAYNVHGESRLICAIMDARRKHLYCGLYTFENDKLITVMKVALLSYEEIVQKLNALDKEVVLVGDGIDVAQDFLKSELTCKYVIAPQHIRTQRAASVARLAMDMAKEGKYADADTLKPEYLRPSQAEREHGVK